MTILSLSVSITTDEFRNSCEVFEIDVEWPFPVFPRGSEDEIMIGGRAFRPIHGEGAYTFYPAEKIVELQLAGMHITQDKRADWIQYFADNGWELIEFDNT